MGIPSPVEELAWLVKDNLYSKHLVLSVEELFVEFLECPLHEDETLELEPMESYQRMLLHRLADLFGLAHESVGEGDDRHLVVEKSEDSLIPAVLVSDVLENGDAGAHHPILSLQLLKRSSPLADEFRTPPASKYPMLTFEERRAAYLAARQRIFSETWKYSEKTSKEVGCMRPRSDPVVARRMIAHALGKPKVLTFTSPSSGSVPPQDLDSQSLVEGVSDKNWLDNSTNGKPSLSGRPRESLQQSSVKAAKRMFANALGLPPGRTPSTVPPRQTSSKIGTCNVPLQSGGGTGAFSSDKDLTDKNLGSVSDSENLSSSTRKLASATPRKEPRIARPGGAAGRIFAQALGLPDPV